MRPRRDRERAAHRPDCAVERELAKDDGVVDLASGNETGRRQHAEGDREVEGRAHLADVGRGEVDRHVTPRKFETGVPDGALHTVAALAHAGVW